MEGGSGGVVEGSARGGLTKEVEKWMIGFDWSTPRSRFGGV